MRWSTPSTAASTSSTPAYEYNTRWAMSRVLKDHPKRHDLHHIIKVPVPDFDDGGKFDAAKFRLRVEEALCDLHTERIDVLQHLQRARPNEDDRRIPDIARTNEAMLECFAQLKAEGKAGYLTTFPYTAGFAGEALKSSTFDGMVAYYNPIEMEMAEYFPQMETNGQGFFCIRPFMGGLLTDRRSSRADLPSDDRYHEEQWDAAYDRLAILEADLGIEILSWTTFAIKFSLCHPIVTSLIVGLNSVEQVDGVLNVADGDYPNRRVFDLAQEIFRREGPVSS